MRVNWLGSAVTLRSRKDSLEDPARIAMTTSTRSFASAWNAATLRMDVSTPSQAAASSAKIAQFASP